MRFQLLVRVVALVIIVIFSMTVWPILANAQYASNVEINLTNTTYHYGERLDYTIIVSDITGEDAKIFIIDPSGVRSLLLNTPISEQETRIVAPISFDSIIWKAVNIHSNWNILEQLIKQILQLLMMVVLGYHIG